MTSTDLSLFYCDVNLGLSKKEKEIIDCFEKYSNEHSIQVYVLNKFLGIKKDFEYLEKTAIILIPKYPILILNYDSSKKTDLNALKEDFIDDLGYIAEKYGYNSILGRKRKWSKDWFMAVHSCDFDFDEYIGDGKVGSKHYRNIELLISLCIGSINDINKIGNVEPVDLLDKIKKKIVLFDGQQSRFILQDQTKKIIRIQGMAGTGKTELLLHKLKNLFLSENNYTLAYTCFNIVLAQDMKSRVPEFFNFFRVEKQIQWDNKLFVFSSWGSAYDKYAGLYGYICSKYNIKFRAYSSRVEFGEICSQALQQLNLLNDFQPCFDYIFIDEAQDFDHSFFALCEKITKYSIYIAGDVFQNIFDRIASNTVDADFMLNKCYRTDPKTLMFAHAVSMGLYEEKRINWLTEEGWKACGYDIKNTKDDIILTRQPLRRFEDLITQTTIELLSYKNDKDIIDKIINIIEDIKSKYISVSVEDIAIIFLTSYNKLCILSDMLKVSLYKNFEWKSTKGYEVKHREKDKVYISNVNNIKGLEFPFVICVVSNTIDHDYLKRNSIYMSLTRSFLTSYLLVDEINKDFISTYNYALEEIKEKGKMKIKKPDDSELNDINRNIIKFVEGHKQKTIQQLVDEYIKQNNIDIKDNIKIKIAEVVVETMSDKAFSEELVNDKIKHALKLYQD